MSHRETGTRENWCVHCTTSAPLFAPWLVPKRQLCRGTVEQSAFQQGLTRVPADLPTEQRRGILVASSQTGSSVCVPSNYHSLSLSFSLVFRLHNLIFRFIFSSVPVSAVGRLSKNRAPHKQTHTPFLTLTLHFGNKVWLCSWFSLSQNTFLWRFFQQLCKLIMTRNTFSWNRWRSFHFLSSLCYSATYTLINWFFQTVFFKNKLIQYYT